MFETTRGERGCRFHWRAGFRPVVAPARWIQHSEALPGGEGNCGARHNVDCIVACFPLSDRADRRSPSLMPAFALTIFAGAFLLFQVQPLIGKYILPWFGGSPGVWTTCMLFFQMLLLGGYAYAHFSSTRLRPRKQVILHLVLLAVSLVL